MAVEGGEDVVDQPVQATELFLEERPVDDAVEHEDKRGGHGSDGEDVGGEFEPGEALEHPEGRRNDCHQTTVSNST